MRPPEYMIPLLRRSHTMRTRVDIFKEGSLLRTDYPVTEGTVQEDRKSNIRRTLQMTVPLWTYEDQPISSYDTVIKPFLIVGTGEYGDPIPLGAFRVDEISRTNYGALSISASSYEAYVVDARFPLAEASIVGAPKKNEIERLLRDALPSFISGGLAASTRFVSTPGALEVLNTSTIERTEYWDRDRWDAIASIAKSEGINVFTDRYGNFVVENMVDMLHPTNPIHPKNQPSAWDFTIGDEGTMIQLQTTSSRLGVFNAVMASYKSQDASNVPGARPLYWYLAVNDNAASPLRWGGPFGKKVRFYESGLLGSLVACQTLAERELSEMILEDRKYRVSGIPNPYLEAGDMVSIDVLRNGVSEMFLVDNVTIPLGVGGSWDVVLNSVERKDVSDNV